MASRPPSNKALQLTASNGAFPVRVRLANTRGAREFLLEDSAELEIRAEIVRLPAEGLGARRIAHALNNAADTNPRY